MTFAQRFAGHKRMRTPAAAMDHALARPLLAMPLHPQDHHDETRRWLDSSWRDRPDEAATPRRAKDPDAIWNDPGIRLLRGGAEAVILHDPVLPADPSAHGTSWACLPSPAGKWPCPDGLLAEVDTSGRSTADWARVGMHRYRRIGEQRRKARVRSSDRGT